MPVKTKNKKDQPSERLAMKTFIPQWPPLTPVGDSIDLSLTSLSPNQIVTVSDLWTSSLCKRYVAFLTTLPLVTTPGTPKKGDAVRVNDRYQIDDATFAQQLWEGTALKELVTTGDIDGRRLSTEERSRLWGGEVLGLNPNIRVYRYSKGQYFDQHYDDSNNVSFPSAASGQSVSAKTTWTLLLYLTSPTTGCVGGETVFYPEAVTKKSRDPSPVPIVANLETGMALLHRHGKDCMLHEGKEVVQGEKWVIRSDLCVKR